MPVVGRSRNAGRGSAALSMPASEVRVPIAHATGASASSTRHSTLWPPAGPPQPRATARHIAVDSPVAQTSRGVPRARQHTRPHTRRIHMCVRSVSRSHVIARAPARALAHHSVLAGAPQAAPCVPRHAHTPRARRHPRWFGEEVGSQTQQKAASNAKRKARRAAECATRQKPYLTPRDALIRRLAGSPLLAAVTHRNMCHNLECRLLCRCLPG